MMMMVMMRLHQAVKRPVHQSEDHLVLQSLLQHVLLLPGEVEQHRHSPDQLEGLTGEQQTVCG